MLVALSLYRFGCPPNDNAARELDECTFAGVKIWDWLDLLGGPIVLAIFGFLLKQWQETRDSKKEVLVKKQEDARLNETILQNYLDKISKLLIGEGIIIHAKHLKPNEQEPTVVSTSRSEIEARTKSVLRRFKGDSERTRSVLEFLSATEVLTRIKPDFSEVDLQSLNLESININEVILDKAKFQGAKLDFAEMSGAKLGNANFSDASLWTTFLKSAQLSCANFSGANLKTAQLQGADLYNARLQNANLKDADLTGAKLEEADLTGANLNGAKLENILYDAKTIWPKGFTPPPSRDEYQAETKQPQETEEVEE